MRKTGVVVRATMARAVAVRMFLWGVDSGNTSRKLGGQYSNSVFELVAVEGHNVQHSYLTSIRTECMAKVSLISFVSEEKVRVG